MTFRIELWYAASADDEPQVHRGLTRDQAEMAVGAFTRDLFGLEGRGVRRIVVSVEPC